MSLRDLIVSIDFDDIDIKKLTKLDDAMDEINDSLNDMDEELDDTSDGFDDMRKKGDRATDGLSNLKNIGVGAITAVTAAIGGATFAMATFYEESDQAMDRLEAKTGATGQELESLKGIAKDVFVDGFGESITEIANDTATMRAMFRDLNDKELNQLMKSSYTISDLWETDIKEVGGVVKNLTSNFKDLSEQRAMDLITTGFQQTGDYAGDLMDTFKEYAPYFSKMGMSAKEFTGILVSGAQAGAWNLDKVGDSLKEFGIRAMDDSDTTKEAFEAIGFNADEMSNKIAAGGDSAKNAFVATIGALSEMDKRAMNTNGVKLFGTQWEDVREDVILSMDDGMDAIQDFEGATERAGEAAYDNFGTVMKTIFRDIKTSLADAFSDNGGAELLDKIKGKAKDLQPTIENLVGKAVSLTNAFAENWPVIREVGIALGTFAGVLASVKGAIALVTAAQTAWNIVMLMSPTTQMVLGISALIAAGVALYRNWDTVKEKLSDLWSAAKSKFGDIKDSVMTSLEPVLNFFDKLGDKFNDFKESFTNFKMPKIGMPKWLGGDGLIQTDGSHAAGLGRVPYDGYVGELHRDESVLTANQSNALRNMGVLSGERRPSVNLGRAVTKTNKTTNNNFSPNINIRVDGGGNAQDIARAAKKATREELERFWLQMQMKGV